MLVFDPWRCPALGFARAGWHVRVVEPDTDASRFAARCYKPGELPLDWPTRACSCGGIAICTP